MTSLPTRLNLRRLKELHLGDNQLSNIEPCTFCAAPHLATLALERNQIVKGLAAAFPPLFSSLTKLQLEGNLLEQEELEEVLNRLPNLATLSLARTGLVSFPADLIDNNKQLTHLNLRCGCYLIENAAQAYKDNFLLSQLQLPGAPGPSGVLHPALPQAPRSRSQLPHVPPTAILPGIHMLPWIFMFIFFAQHLSFQAVTTSSSLQLVYLQVNIADQFNFW